MEKKQVWILTESPQDFDCLKEVNFQCDVQIFETSFRCLEAPLFGSYKPFLILDLRETKPTTNAELIDLANENSEHWNTLLLPPTSDEQPFPWADVPLNVHYLDHLSLEHMVKKLELHHKKRVLLIDDESELLYILEQILSDTCFVYTANDIDTALTTLKTQEIDCILCDMMMPLNGIKTYEKIQDFLEGHEVAFAFLTGGDQNNELWKQIPLNVKILSKPYQEDDIVNWIYSSSKHPKN